MNITKVTVAMTVVRPKEILQNLVNNLIDAAQSWHAHRHEAK